ncbi:Imm10 family immunity protein [Actinomadura sp. K4S16]|uniref:Imm10 family immunity protein n=1 Tax=Actinomadura sp. K4S16 TaxID=1316147 RepID=UPI0011EBF4C8|nr:Imm10 family immunity protein [Actinomadura sp. K4S16]
MAFTFTARAVGAETYEDDECFIAGVAEHEDGSGRQLTFMCSLYEPEDQDIATGMDSYCLVTPGQGTAYGGVREAVLKDRVLRIVVDPANLEALRLNDAEIEVALDVEDAHIQRFREGLRRVLAYGRQSEWPTVLEL